jgi:hypothetical protein
MRPLTARSAPELGLHCVLSHCLWTMAKGTTRRHACARMLPVGTGRIELAVYHEGTRGKYELLWAMTIHGGAAVNDIAQLKQREYEAQGWVMEPPLKRSAVKSKPS